MDREKLKVIREALILKTEDMDGLGKHNAYFAYFAYLDDILKKIVDALLEDDKSKTAPDLVIPEERRRKRIEELTRKISKYRWTPEEVKAIKESLIHWRDNVSRLKLADELGLDITLSPVWATWLAMMPWGVGNKAATFSSKDCALCDLFYESCKDCPLSKIGDACVEKHSTYRKCGEAKGNEEIIKAAENMVKVLESLLE